MSVAPGTCLGGLRTLRALRARCCVEADHWLLADDSGQPLPTVADRRIWIYGHGRRMQAPRAVWLLAKRPIPDGHEVWAGCTVPGCVALAHLMCGPRVQRGQWMRDSGILRGRPERSASARRAGAQRAIVSDELVRWAIESSQPQHVVAHALGVHRSLVGQFRRGERRRATVATSVWQWGGGR